MGVSRFWSKKAAHISGIKVLGRFTIQFHLTAPDIPFLNVLAMPFADVVPHEWVKKEGSRFADNPVGTGPYRLAAWHQNVNMLLVKNPTYFRKGLPHIARVHIDFGVNPDLQVERAEKGTWICPATSCPAPTI